MQNTTNTAIITIEQPVERHGSKGTAGQVNDSQINQVVEKIMTGPGNVTFRLDRVLSSIDGIQETDNGSSIKTKLFKPPDSTVRVKARRNSVDRWYNLDEEIFCISKNTPLLRGQKRSKAVVQNNRQIITAALDYMLSTGSRIAG